MNNNCKKKNNITEYSLIFVKINIHLIVLYYLLLRACQERFLMPHDNCDNEMNQRDPINFYEFILNSLQIRESAVYLMDSDEDESLVSLLGILKGVVCLNLCLMAQC